VLGGAAPAEVAMSDSHASLDDQIAALESALKLPLPDETRDKLQQDLGKLRQQKTGPTGIHGTTNVSGTLYGSAIGVNLGTVNTHYGAQPPSAGPQGSTQASQEQIDDQLELLDAHRRTLSIYLKQQAQLGSAYAPPGVANGIHEARLAIRRIKATLRGWGRSAADHPDDEEPR
jgi:hypothetical protein